jgi:hypothetical protein
VANFNLADYETVDSRIKRFYVDHPAGRITTDLVDFTGEPGKTRWIVKASVWRGGFGEPVDPDGTGFAFENDGDGMANKTSALENCETSAIGRALANIGYSGDKRASREEMTKAKGEVPASEDTRALDALVLEWVEQAKAAETIAALQAVWEQAGASGVTKDKRMIDATNARKKELS